MNYETDLNNALKRLKDIEFVLNESTIVVFTDNQGTIQFVNDRFCEISKYSPEELIGNNQNIVNSGYHSDEFFHDMWSTIRSGKVWRGEIKNKAKDGTYYWVDTTIVPFSKIDGEIYQYVAVRHDITKLKNHEESIKQLAYDDDPLTMLKNRHWLNNWMKNQVNNELKEFTVLFLDVDDFKSVNDNFGHSAGDTILKSISERIQYCLHPSDFVVRQGGDEFIIFLHHAKSNKEMVLNIIDKLYKQVSLPFYVNDKQLFVTVSIGISMNTNSEKYENQLAAIEATVKQADTAMHHAKKQYGNNHCFNTRSQNKEMKRYYELVPELKQALFNNEFHIVYQPIINMKTEEMEGVEALLRWNNPQLGNITPFEFIPLLEELGLIIPVGNWVLQSVCKQMREWHDKGIQMERASVNVSPLQFNNENFVKDVKGFITSVKLDPSCIELEITEGTLMNIAKSEKTLTELRELGVTISIDDFGTGYSSLSYLNQLPINTLKIDKSFIDNLSKDGEVIVNTIITMGNNLNFKVLAEGVESEKQSTYLKSQNCHEGQGYFWSKPVQAKEIEKIFHERFQHI